MLLSILFSQRGKRTRFIWELYRDALAQGGPGCAGQFGNFYELGPQWIDSDLNLLDNPGAWNQAAGLLFVDQPVGVGFSPSGMQTDKVGCECITSSNLAWILAAL